MTKISKVLYWLAISLIGFWLLLQVLLLMFGFIWGGLSVADGTSLCQKKDYKVQIQLGWEAGCYLWEPNN